MTAAKRFETKEQAQAYRPDYYLGYVAIFISDHYAACHGVARGGWYLWSRKATQQYAV